MPPDAATQILPWAVVHSLLEVPDIEVQAQVLALLRNLCHSVDADQFVAASVVQWSENKLLPILARQLAPGAYNWCNAPCSSSSGGGIDSLVQPSAAEPFAACGAGTLQETISQIANRPAGLSTSASNGCGAEGQSHHGVEACLEGALFTVVNIAAGTEGYKNAIMAAGIPSNLAHHLRNPHCPEIRFAAAFCLVNLLFEEAPAGDVRCMGPTSTSNTAGAAAAARSAPVGRAVAPSSGSAPGACEAAVGTADMQTDSLLAEAAGPSLAANGQVEALGTADAAAGRRGRQQQLVDLGMVRVLEEMQELDSELQVRETVRNALKLLASW